MTWSCWPQCPNGWSGALPARPAPPRWLRWRTSSTPHSNWTRAEAPLAHALRLWRTRFRVLDKKIGTGVKRMPQSKQDGQRKSRIGDGAAAKQRQLDSFSQGPENLLTTNQGVVIPDNHNSLKAGVRGPSLLEDFILREKITHFDHERIPER